MSSKTESRQDGEQAEMKFCNCFKDSIYWAGFQNSWGIELRSLSRILAQRVDPISGQAIHCMTGLLVSLDRACAPSTPHPAAAGMTKMISMMQMAGGALRWGPIPATAPVFPTIGGEVHGYGGCVLQCVGTLRMAQLAKYKGKQSRWQTPQRLIVAALRGFLRSWCH